MEWSPSHSASYYVTLAALVGASLLLARRFAKVSTARSLLLLGLRAAVLAVLLVILLEPVRVTATRAPAQPPSAVYLVDCSRSMALEQPISRFDQARRTMASAEAQLAVADRPKIDLYGFGDLLRALDQVGQLKAAENETRLREALTELTTRVIATLPKGVFLFSDGRSTETTGLDQIAHVYRRLKVPIHVIPVGSPQSAGDVAIQSVVVPREARSATKLPVRVVIRGRGFAGERAELRIRSLTNPASPPLASLPLTLTDGEISRELVIESDRSRGPLVVEISPLPNEAVLANNRVPFQVIQRDPKIRVIYMEGTEENQEYSWLRDALAEDPNIECLAIVVHDQFGAQQLRRVDDPARGYPTTREELFSYDVVICSDVARNAFTPEQLEWTVELVNQRGGGFVMVGGYTSFGAGRWDATSWDGMIPVDMSGSATGGDRTLDEIKLKIQIPPEAQAHPIWHLVDDPAKNREILASMPLFYGTNLTDRLKPAATVLGLAAVALPGPQQSQRGMAQQQPGRGAGSSGDYLQAPPGQSLIPVFSCQPYGKGRTFAFSSDTTSGWGRDFERFWGENDNRYFRKFWRNVVVWLAENSTNANRRLEVETDKVLYHPGEPVLISARAFDERLEPTQTYRLVTRLQAPDEQPGALASPQHSKRMVATDSPGVYQAELRVPRVPQWPISNTNPAEAVHKLVLRVAAYDRDTFVTQSELDIQVIDDSPEYRDVRPDRSSLALLARESGGRVLTDPRDLADMLMSYRAGGGAVTVVRTPIWATPAVCLALIVLLTTEWIVRRTKGLA